MNMSDLGGPNKVSHLDLQIKTPSWKGSGHGRVLDTLIILLTQIAPFNVYIHFKELKLLRF